ncbi:MAG TPA: SCO family protein [Puia sp.]|uniref:SCO family protein n=1 Tax=Puia sp. TaxID=2045100 RepID=UPI002C1170FC|nr:SCO family protein [Puia sp.]HVU94321.1 SCO family protein [Puia sp.]
MITLRRSSLLLLVVTATVLSCHRRSVSAPISCCSRDNESAAPLLPGTSIYQLPGIWSDQHDHRLSLNQLKGKVRVVAMIFTHCGYACPRLVQDIKQIEVSLPAGSKDRVGYVLVSFDSQKDIPSQLSRFASQQGLGNHWELLHGDAGQVRELSMLLNIRYQQLGESNFSHTNGIFILDATGAIARSIDGLDPQTSVAVNTINQLLAKP